jgi:hypothetical protein
MTRDQNRSISIVWDISDVQEVRPDLDDGQAWEVLKAVKHKHDANEGVNWLVLESWADHLYPGTGNRVVAEDE